MAALDIAYTCMQVIEGYNNYNKKFSPKNYFCGQNIKTGTMSLLLDDHSNPYIESTDYRTF